MGILTWGMMIGFFGMVGSAIYGFTLGSNPDAQGENLQIWKTLKRT